MIDWKRGGWTGSLNGFVRKEIREHFKENASARRAQYALHVCVMQRIFAGTFWQFLALYFVFALLICGIEVLFSENIPDTLSEWEKSVDLKLFVPGMAATLIEVEVGVLGIISLSIGLVTIIAQRENATTDVQLYYHESLAFGVVASAIALTAVLCVQLFWPMQVGIHFLGFGTELLVFKLVFTTVHGVWLFINICGMAHFVAATLQFVQKNSREIMRERYTANVVLPTEMTKILRAQLYLAAGPDFIQQFWPEQQERQREPSVWFGTDLSLVGEGEIPLKSNGHLVLRDVRMTWVKWVVRRWLQRCSIHDNMRNRHRRGLRQEHILVFPPPLDEPIVPGVYLCRSRGPQLTRFEKLILRCSFKFGHSHDER